LFILAPTDPKIGADLMANSLVYGRGNIDERTVTICSGIDFVQISHTNITGADPATAKVIYNETIFCYLISLVCSLGMD
jgi:hypothetical protein